MKIEFIEETHSYLVDGILTPSVSELINWYFDEYTNIPKSILNEKAKYGTKAHELIENYLLGKRLNLKGINPYLKASIQEFKSLPKIEVKDVEQMGTYEGLICGRYDIKDKEGTIYDIKTTSKLMLDNEGLQAPLNLQISCYYLIDGNYKDYGKVIWLPMHDSPRIEKVKTWNKKELIELIKKFRKDNGYEQWLWFIPRT